MSSNFEDYLRVMREWGDATVAVTEKYKQRRSELTEGMDKRMHASEKDPSDIVFEIMEERGALKEREREERDAVYRKFRTILDAMRGDS